MGLIKQMQLEEAEREYAEHLRETQEFLDDMHRQFPQEGWNEWDPETYEAYLWACEKDD